MSTNNNNLEGVDLENLRIRLNRNVNIFTYYPKLRIDEAVTNEELSGMLSEIITRLNLNPTLKDVDMSLSDLQDYNLSGANLNGVNFSNKKLDNCNLSYCDLVGAKFNSNDSILGVDFSFADLTGAEFIDTELYDTDFTFANLTGANFSGAALSGVTLDNADMSRANVSNASFADTEFSRTNIQDIIYNNFTEFPDLDEAVNVSEALMNRNIQQANRDIEGVAYEIHNVFNKIDIDKYHEIIKSSAAVIRKGGPRGNWDLKVITAVLETIIDQDFPENKTEQTRAKTKLHAILNRLKNSSELKQDSVMKLVSDTMQFVFNQRSKDFKVLYVSAFIQDCYHAYSDPGTGLPFETEKGMSCVKGIVERVIWIIGDTVQAICSDKKKCTTKFKELLDVFGKNKLDINDLTQQWSTEVLATDEFQDKTKITKEQVRKSFIDFMKKKYSAVGLWIPTTIELVEKRANELDYVFNDRMFGGRNRRRTKRAKKTRKTRNEKNKLSHISRKKRSINIKKKRTIRRVKK